MKAPVHTAARVWEFTFLGCGLSSAVYGRRAGNGPALVIGLAMLVMGIAVELKLDA